MLVHRTDEAGYFISLITVSLLSKTINTPSHLPSFSTKRIRYVAFIFFIEYASGLENNESV